MSKQPPGFNPREQDNAVEVARTSSRQPSKKTKQKELRKKFPKLFSLRCWDILLYNFNKVQAKKLMKQFKKAIGLVNCFG